MLIQVTSEVLNDPKWHPLLDVVVTVLERPNSRHTFDPSRYAEVASSTWLNPPLGTRATIPELIRGSIRRATRDGLSDAVALLIDAAAPAEGEILNSSVVRIHPLGALAILLLPLQVIVEDETSDGAFILWMARLLGRDVVRKSYDSGQLTFRHAGGKGQLHKSARALTYGIWPRPGKRLLELRLRTVVFLDSDARYPGDSPNSDIEASLIPDVAFVHVLKGRTIENYVPAQFASRRLANNGRPQAIEAFFRLPEEQRLHFPMKLGFADQITGQPQSKADFLIDAKRPQAERDHFSNIPLNEWQLLAPGFGRTLADVYQDPDYRCASTQYEILILAHRDELNRFFTLLIKYL